MSTKSPSSVYAPGEDVASVEANRAYQDALQKLTDSLDQRKNRFFDPRYLAAARGFLEPGAPNFFESLGRVAKNVDEAQEAGIKEDQAIALQRVNVASQGVELQRMKARDKEISDYINGRRSPAAPRASVIAGPEAGPSVGPLSTSLSAVPGEPIAGHGALPSVLPSLGASAAGSSQGALSVVESPPGFDGVRGIPVMPPNQAFMSQDEYVALNLQSGKSLGQLLSEGAKHEGERYKSNEKGTTDFKTGLRYSYDDGAFVSVPIMGPGFNGQSFTIPASVAMRLTNLANANDFEGYAKLAKQFTGGFGSQAVSKTVPSDAQRDLDKKRREALQVAEVTQEVDDRKNFVQRARDAQDAISTSSMFRRFAEDPEADKMFGILNNNKISSAFLTMLRDGVGVPGFTGGTAVIEDVIRNLNLNPAQQAKYRAFLMFATQMQLQQSKYMKGSVSNLEQGLMRDAGINNKDTPETIRIKADLFALRAQFDIQANRAFKAARGRDKELSAEDFLDSDEYAEMRRRHDVNLTDLVSGSKILAPSAPKPSAPTGGRDLDAARKRLDAILK